MAGAKRSDKEDLVRELFVALAAKWDVHDRPSGRHLAQQCLEAVDGFYEELDKAFATKKPAKKPEKPV